MKAVEILSKMREENSRQFFSKMYGAENVEKSLIRYTELINGYEKRFGSGGDIELYSAPGRTELCGNHTDHNCGKVLAGSINLDCIGVATKQYGNVVNIVSVDYGLDFSIDINTLEGSKSDSTVMLVTGLIDGFKKRGHSVGGFNAYITSNVIAAAGISSSASFEMLICAIINDLYNDNKLDMIEYAKIGKHAENNYWEKSSGLLDQMSCAVGGIVNIDFKDEENPKVIKMDIDFEKEGYGVVIVNTGKSHADLSEEYSAIPEEMKSVAKYFGKNYCSEIDLMEIINNIKELRLKLGDRAILRAIHYLNENRRVEQAVKDLKNGNFGGFLKVIEESGESSWKILQNCYSVENYKEQGIPLALTLTKMFLEEKGRGVCRVHGGGFAGVIMAIIDLRDISEYVEFMETKFMENSTYKMMIRPYGAINVLKTLQ